MAEAVSTSVLTWRPVFAAPQLATKSASILPIRVSPHSAKVRSGICCRGSEGFRSGGDRRTTARVGASIRAPR